MYVLIVSIEKINVSSQRFFIFRTLTAQLIIHLTYFVSSHNYIWTVGSCTVIHKIE